MTRYRLALATVAVLIVGAVLFTVMRAPDPPVTASSTGGQVLPASQRIAAPDFTGIDGWLNSVPLSLARLHGKVVLIDFWTFSCVNCVRTIPHLKVLYDAYKDRGLVIVGVHSPSSTSRRCPPTSHPPSRGWGSHGRSPLTATWPRGTRIRTSTGRRSTCSTSRVASPTPASARVTTRRQTLRSPSCSTSTRHRCRRPHRSRRTRHPSSTQAATAASSRTAKHTGAWDIRRVIRITGRRRPRTQSR